MRNNERIDSARLTFDSRSAMEEAEFQIQETTDYKTFSHPDEEALEVYSVEESTLRTFARMFNAEAQVFNHGTDEWEDLE